MVNGTCYVIIIGIKLKLCVYEQCDAKYVLIAMHLFCPVETDRKLDSVWCWYLTSSEM